MNCRNSSRRRFGSDFIWVWQLSFAGSIISLLLVSQVAHCFRWPLMCWAMAIGEVDYTYTNTRPIKNWGRLFTDRYALIRLISKLATGRNLFPYHCDHRWITVNVPVLSPWQRTTNSFWPNLWKSQFVRPLMTWTRNLNQQALVCSYIINFVTRGLVSSLFH